MTAPVPPLTRYEAKITLDRSGGYGPIDVLHDVYLAAEVDARDVERNIQLTDARAEVTRLEAEVDRYQAIVEADSAYCSVADERDRLRAETVALRAACEQLIAQWNDQGAIHSAMKKHPQKEWFNGAGDTMQTCAKQVRAALLAADQGAT